MLRAMSEPLAAMLTGGHPSALGRTAEVVAVVLADGARLGELLACLDSDDATVRMRAGDALEKVCRDRPDRLAPETEWVLGHMGAVAQPSVQWHVAQILGHLRDALSDDQIARATRLLKRNLAGSDDWIVLTTTMDILADWARADPALAAWLAPRLERLATDRRPAVAKRATRSLAMLRDDRY